MIRNNKRCRKAGQTGQDQWYQRYPDIQKREIEMVREQFPFAELGYLSNGNMYWDIRMEISDQYEPRVWEIRAEYSRNFSSERGADSILISPLKPTIEDLVHMVKNATIQPKTIPNLCKDIEGRTYIAPFKVGEISGSADQVTSVNPMTLGYLFLFKDWATQFVHGLQDQESWTRFMRFGLQSGTVAQDEPGQTEENKSGTGDPVAPSEPKHNESAAGNESPTNHGSTPAREPSEENASEVRQEDADPIEKWIAKCPFERRPEVEYLAKIDTNLAIQIREDACLGKAFQIGGCTFLLVLDKDFPKRSENGSVPMSVYLVYPKLDTLKNKLHLARIPDLQHEPSSGYDCLVFRKSEQDFSDYVNRRCGQKCYSQMVYERTIEWVANLGKTVSEGERSTTDGSTEKSARNREREYRHAPRARYKNQHLSLDDSQNKKCQKIVLSQRAYAQIMSETYSKIRTETGGLLLGHYLNGIWYVVEACDPGINAVFSVAYHEGDEAYENHVCGVMSRLYKHPLVFLGMWHRHPGSMDVFSSTDDVTNRRYVDSVGNGCISALVNLDPDFRLTFYYVEHGDRNDELLYTRVKIEVDDAPFTELGINQYASIEDIQNRRS